MIITDFTPQSVGTLPYSQKNYNSPSAVFESKKPSTLEKQLQSAQQLFKTVPLITTVGLLTAGFGSAYLGKWFLQGLKEFPNTPQKVFQHLHLPNHQMERQTAIYFQKGLPGIVMMALKYPQLQNRLKAYIASGVIGYLLASIAKGAQEVMVRQAETQIRADLMTRLKNTFEKSLKLTHQQDQALKQTSVQRLQAILNQYELPLNLEKELQQTVLPHTLNWRYPYEPVHFSQPFTAAYPPKMGQQNNHDDPTLIPNNTLALNWVKPALFGLGVGSGALVQSLQKLLMQSRASIKTANGNPLIKKTLLEITNAQDWEALFLVGNKKVLFSLLGLGAVVKLGKLLVEGYREIEVTRKNAQTEEKYQRYNWLNLDPAFRKIAEEQALNQGLKLFETTVFKAKQGQASTDQVLKTAETLLSNIGRESAPKYFAMTPSINLVAARG